MVVGGFDYLISMQEASLATRSGHPYLATVTQNGSY